LFEIFVRISIIATPTVFVKVSSDVVDKKARIGNQAVRLSASGAMVLMLQIGRMLRITGDDHFNNAKNQIETWFCYRRDDVLDSQGRSRIQRFYLRESRRSRGRILRVDYHDDAVYFYELQDQFRTCSQFDVHFFADEDFVVSALGEKFNRIASSDYRPLGRWETVGVESSEIFPGGVVENQSSSTMVRDYFGVSNDSLLMIERGHSTTMVWWGYAIEDEQISLI
jgi:hypothetical protein